MFQTKYVEKIKTHILCSITFVFFFLSDDLAVYEIMRENIVDPGRPHIIWRIRIACCIPKATDTHSKFVILLFHDNNGETNASHCYVILTLPVLLRL